MKQLQTIGIVLSRTNYQESDRILTILTPDNGKVRVLAKGVRKSRSKLAGGVELFSVSEIGYMRGRGELSTLISSRLLRHYGNIAQNIDRTMLGYDLIKLLNKVTEDEPEESYFELLQTAFESLNQPDIQADLIKLWYYAQLLRLAGHTPNLRTGLSGTALDRDASFVFSYDDMVFSERHDGPFEAGHIKFLRLVFGNNKPGSLQKVQGAAYVLPACLNLVLTILPNHIRT